MSVRARLPGPLGSLSPSPLRGGREGQDHKPVAPRTPPDRLPRLEAPTISSCPPPRHRLGLPGTWLWRVRPRPPLDSWTRGERPSDRVYARPEALGWDAGAAPLAIGVGGDCDPTLGARPPQLRMSTPVTDWDPILVMRQSRFGFGGRERAGATIEGREAW